MIKIIKKINKDLDKDLPIFAKEDYLKTLSADYGWFISEKFIIPFVFFKKYIFRYLTFTYELIPLSDIFTLLDEKDFLNEVIKMLKKLNIDFITQPPTYVLFNNYPDKSEYISFGTYIIDLSQPEDIIFQNIYKEHKHHIRKSKKNGIIIERGLQLKDICYRIINEKQKSQGLYFMNKQDFDKLVTNLKDNLEIFVSKNNDKYEIASLIFWDNHSAYTVYSGSTIEHDLGANNYLIWEAIKYFKSINIHKFNFVGARLFQNSNPKQINSKILGIQEFKRRFGGTLRTGVLWKYNIHPFKKKLFDYLILLKTGKRPKDIIDNG